MKRFLLNLILIFFCFFHISAIAQWTQLAPGAFPFSYTWVEAIAGNEANIFTGTHSNGVFLSTDGGTTWTALSSGLPAGTITYSFALNGSNIFAGTNNNWGIYLSINNGTTWTQTGLTGIAINCITVSGSNMLVGTNGYGVYLSTDNGTNWTTANTGLDNKYVTTFAMIGTNLFAGTLGGTNYGVFASADNGTTWAHAVMTGFASANISTLSAIGTNLFAGTSTGMYLSTDNGTSWTQVNTGLTNLNVRSAIVSGSNLFVGTNGGGVYLSTDNGTSWTIVKTGLGNLYVYSLAIIGTDLYAGTLGSGIWRRSLSEMVTSVEEYKDANLPVEFELSQNYPNPFNPSTNIRFEIPVSGFVSLKVFDVLGREVVSLVNEFKPAGFYNVNFDASKLSSGVYFYQLRMSKNVETKQMMLIK
jgi:photosystem II stability/assembly factor-like uncharacterized protein